MTEIRGKLFDGESSAVKIASLSFDATGLAEEFIVRLIVDGQEQQIASSDLIVSSRLGASSRYIEIVDIGRFETSDNDAVDKLAKAIKPKGANLLYRLESHLGLIAIGVIVTAAFLWAFVKFGIPAAGDYIVDKMPDKSLDLLEQKILASVEDKWFSESSLSPERQDELQRLFQQVKTDLGSTGDYKFKLFDAEETVGANALAFPSGTIVMTDQLVAIVKDDIQLAGVMAHEIGHLDSRHSMRQIARGSLLTFLVAWASGDISGASSLVITAPTLLLQMSYSREFEEEADGYALRYVGCDKHKLKLMSEFFTTLDRELSGDDVKIPSNESKRPTNFSEYISSHPASHKRSYRFDHHHRTNCL